MSAGLMISSGTWMMVLPAGCGPALPPPETVAFVDLNRYAGRWYEIANYPVIFQLGCTGTTAEYTPLNNGEIRVVNTCRQGRLDGPINRVEGRARVVDPATNARLKVRFYGPFEGDYWIIDLDAEYQYAVVSVPDRSMLWILSRTPTMPEETWQRLLGRLADKGFDTSRLVRTLQPGG